MMRIPQKYSQVENSKIPETPGKIFDRSVTTEPGEARRSDILGSINTLKDNRSLGHKLFGFLVSDLDAGELSNNFKEVKKSFEKFQEVGIKIPRDIAKNFESENGTPVLGGPAYINEEQANILRNLADEGEVRLQQREESQKTQSTAVPPEYGSTSKEQTIEELKKEIAELKQKTQEQLAEQAKTIEELKADNNDLIQSRLEGMSQFLELDEKDDKLIAENNELKKDLDRTINNGEKLLSENKELLKENRELQRRQVDMLGMGEKAIRARDQVIEQNDIQKFESQEAHKTLHEQENQIAQLDKENKNLLKENAHLKANSQKQVTENIHLTNELAKTKKDKKSFESQAIKLRAQNKFYKDIQQENKDLKATVAELRTEVDENEKTIEELKKSNQHGKL